MVLSHVLRLYTKANYNCTKDEKITKEIYDPFIGGLILEIAQEFENGNVLYM